MKVATDMFDQSEFEEPELYESMKILKSLKHDQKKSNLHDLKKASKKERTKEKDRIKSKLKRPCLDLEKMMKVVQIRYTHYKLFTNNLF